MWRIFRWLDTHEPGFYKLTVMIFGLAAVAGVGFLLALAHPAAGIVFGYAAIFALLRASHVYRFDKKPPGPRQADLPLSQASDADVLRRVRRSARTEFWRKQVLAARHEKGKRGDLARAIIKRWEEAGTPDGRPVPKDEGERN